jgi:hypothetical protein
MNQINDCTLTRMELRGVGSTSAKDTTVVKYLDSIN